MEHPDSTASITYQNLGTSDFSSFSDGKKQFSMENAYPTDTTS